MSEEDIFLLEILARPDDDAPRLIYADWLEDHDDPRADLVRRDWELRAGPGGDSRRLFEQQRTMACREYDWVEYDGLVLTWEQFVLVFRLRLAETVAFCAARELPLRTWDLEPRSLIGRITGRGWPRAPDIDWPRLVQQLAIGRRRYLERDGRAPNRPATSLAAARLLFCDPRAGQGDRQAMTSSVGYFDADTLPPWDTWIVQVPEPSPVPPWGDPKRITPHYLIAWVPPAYIQRVNAGIDTNEEHSIAWLHQTDMSFVRRLRTAGVLG